MLKKLFIGIWLAAGAAPATAQLFGQPELLETGERHSGALALLTRCKERAAFSTRMTPTNIMNLRIIRRVSIWLIATLAFAQASVAIAACSMDRGSLAPMLEMAGDCGDCETLVKPDAPQYANRCVAHCTSDLQLSGSLAALAAHPADVPVLVLPRAEVDRVPRAFGEASPPGVVPVRILLHSFLI